MNRERSSRRGFFEDGAGFPDFLERSGTIAGLGVHSARTIDDDMNIEAFAQSIECRASNSIILRESSDPKAFGAGMPKPFRQILCAEC